MEDRMRTQYVIRVRAAPRSAHIYKASSLTPESKTGRQILRLQYSVQVTVTDKQISPDHICGTKSSYFFIRYGASRLGNRTPTLLHPLWHNCFRIQISSLELLGMMVFSCRALK